MSAYRKKLFGTKSLNDITLGDIDEQVEHTRALSRLLGKEEYKKVKTFLSELREEKLAAVERQEEQMRRRKAKYTKLRAKYDKEAVKRDERAAAYVAKRIEYNQFKRNMAAALKEVALKKGKTYLVGYNAGIKFKINGGAERFENVVISAEVEAKEGESRFDMLERAKELWIQKNIDDGVWSKPYDFVIMWRRNVFIVPILDNKLTLIPMKGLTMFYNSLPEVLHVADGKCIRDYIYWEGQKADSRVSWTRTYLDTWKLTNTEDIIAFAKAHNVSVYAVDMIDNVYEIFSAEKPRVWFMFKNNNNHLYPITDPAIRQSVVKAGKLSIQEINMSYKDFDDFEVKRIQDVLFDITQEETELKECVIVKDVDDLSSLAAAAMTTSGHMLERYTFRDGDMTAFQHPTRNQIYLAAPEYDMRKSICDKREKRYKLADDRFVNQSIAKIGRTILDNTHGKIPSSSYSPDLQMIFETYPESPVRWCSAPDKSMRHTSTDISKCYPTALRDNVEWWPVFSFFDCIKPLVIKSVDQIKPGLYYTEAFSCYKVKIQRGFHFVPLIKYALNEGFITLSDITYGIVASGSFRANAFKKFVDETMTEYGKDGKHIVNHTIGGFGSLYHKSEKAGITTDILTAVATRNLYAADKDTKLTPVGNFFALRVIDKVMKDGGDYPIFRSVIEMGWIALDKMAKAIDIPGETQFIGCNTDAWKITGNYNKKKVAGLGESCEMGGYREEDTEGKKLSGRHPDEFDEPPEYVYRSVVINETVDTPIGDESCIVDAEPGAGKSYTINKIFREGDIVICKTHLACENLKEASDNKIKAHTIDSFLFDQKTNKLNIKALANAKRVICDEYTMIPPTEMNTILKAKKHYGFILILFGDSNQCRSLDEMWVNYITNKRLLEEFNGRIVRLSYKFTRYDADLHSRLIAFRANGRLALPDNNIVPSYFNLCVNNKARHPINQQCLERWVKEKKATLVSVAGMKVAVGLEVMCYDNNDIDRGIYKTNRFIIDRIDKASITLHRKDKVIALTHKEFTDLFDYSFCVTIYKFQGGQINQHFNIFQADLMSRNELLTCVSRGFSADKVHIDRLRTERYEWDTEHHVHMGVHPPSIRTGRIYELSWEHSEYHYIGKTTQNLEERLEQHIQKPTNKQTKEAFLNGGKCSIRKLDEFKYSSERVFALIEKYYIENAEKLLNVCYNVKDLEKKKKEMPKMKKVKYNITDDASKKRYSIRYTREGKEVAERFPYGADKEAAFAVAEKRQAILLAQ